MKIVYVGISGDFIHHGIINIIEQAASYGEVIVGCLTDAAITEFKPLPILSFEHRKRVIENIKGVSKVVAQEDWDYSVNLKAIKPDFMIHGDDWRGGSMSHIRDNCIEVLNSYGGKLFEIPYTPDVSASLLSRDLHSHRASSSQRQKLLRRLIDSKKIVRIMEAYSPISAPISENVVCHLGEVHLGKLAKGTINECLSLS